MMSLHQFRIIVPLLLLIFQSLDASIFGVSDSDVKKYSNILTQPKTTTEMLMDVLESIPTKQPPTDSNDMCSRYSTIADTRKPIPQDVKEKNAKVINKLNLISAVVEKLSPIVGGNETHSSLFPPSIQDYFQLIDNLYKKSVHLRTYDFNDDLGSSMKLLADYSQSLAKEYRYMKYISKVINLTIMNCTSPVPSFNENYFKIPVMKNDTASNNNTAYSDIQMHYYRLLNLMMHEIKVFTVMAHGYSINPPFASGSETAFDFEIEEIVDRMKNYIQATNNSMKKLTDLQRKIRASHPTKWIRGETFSELEHYRQYKHMTAEEMSKKNCSTTTETLDGETCITREVDCITNGCTAYKQLELCFAPSGAARDLYWFKNEDGKKFGKYYNNETCSRKIIYGSATTSNSSNDFMCEVQKKHKINLAAQEVNVEKNYIVTGVKIVREKETLSVQIQQGVLEAGGIVQNSSVSWKQLEYGEPAYLSNIMVGLDLNAVKIPDGYVVTGVGFKKWMNNTYTLAVRGSKYNFLTGELNFTDSKYYPDPPLVNKHKGTPYVCRSYGASELPFNGDEPESVDHDTWIQFHSSGEDDDAGQTTFPLLDIQPVQTVPPSPLKGVGLFYKRTIKYGGFIAPEIYPNFISFELDP